MIIRIALISAVSLVLAASASNAQGRQPQQVVLSEAVMKSIVANKPKSKIPLTARVGMRRRSNVIAAKPGRAAPTAVREIQPISTK